MDFGQPTPLQSPNLSWVYQLQNPQAQTAQNAQQLLQAMAAWKKKNQLQSVQQSLQTGPDVNALQNKALGYDPNGSMYS